MLWRKQFMSAKRLVDATISFPKKVLFLRNSL